MYLYVFFSTTLNTKQNREQAALNADVYIHSLTSFPGNKVTLAPYGLTGRDQECYLCSESQHED